MKTSTVKGTFDWLPKDAQLRDYLQSSILRTYQSYGFQRIMTPILEDAENLDKSEGGENLNLIFRILKRGEKLDQALQSQDYNNLSDIGLRYDLTLPLSRYYANNRANLISPFKCIQIDKVYRAERPQKGRLREFVQCDIDILGSTSPYCEVELINTTAAALHNIGMTDFKVVINDRSLLTLLLVTLGFPEDKIPSVCISFDKLDKINASGVRDELLEKEMPAVAVDGLMKLLDTQPVTLDNIRAICGNVESIERLEFIIKTVGELSGGTLEVEFNMSLVRGQGYYTGTVFEIVSPHFRGAISGGGRYDNLIGKFIGEKVPAVGFSIGFERIFGILSESGFTIPDVKKKLAVVYNSETFIAAAKHADELRAEYDVALFEFPKKLGKLLDRLEEQGFAGFLVEGEASGIKFFK